MRRADRQPRLGQQQEILKLLRSLPEPGKRSVVMVTHDPSAASYGDRLVHIRDGLIASEVANPRGPVAPSRLMDHAPLPAHP